METTEKAQLIERLKAAIAESGLSNNKFAVERLDITTGMLSQVLNNWQSDNVVGVGTWNKIIKYLDAVNGYKGIPTDNFKKVCEACQRAYESKVFIPVIGSGGFGKSYPLEWFKKHQESIKGFKVYYINAESITTGKQLLTEILKVLSTSTAGTIKQQIQNIKDALFGKDCLLVIDEISSLKDHRVTIIKELMTALKGICGIIFAGTPYFMDNLNKGANKGKHLFSETRDRLFAINYTLQPPTNEDAEEIFKVNGMSTEAIQILMGRHKNKELTGRFAWYNKPTFRGISDALISVQIALTDINIAYPQTITV